MLVGVLGCESRVGGKELLWASAKLGGSGVGDEEEVEGDEGYGVVVFADGKDEAGGVVEPSPEEVDNADDGWGDNDTDNSNVFVSMTACF